MASKYHYYVLVCAIDGARFVTGLATEGKFAYWDEKEKPKEYSKAFAEQLAVGITCNGNNAYCIKVPYEITHQPYMYELGHFEWVVDKKKGD